MNYRLVLVRQKGLLPNLICWFTKSAWNHVGLMDEEGQIWDLDYNGPGVYSMDCRPHWRFKVLPLQTAGPQLPSNHAKYHYDILQNLNWVYAKLGLKFSLYQTGSYHKNCVGLIADAFGRPDWAALAPGDFEKLSL